MRSVRFLIVIMAAAGLLALANASAATRLVLFEEFSQWNCGPCAAANPHVKNFLDANAGSVIGIRYHGWWPGQDNDPMHLWDATDHIGRINYLGPNDNGSFGEPAAAIDGAYITGGSYTGYPGSESVDATAMNARLGVSTPLTLTITETPMGDQINVHIVASSTGGITGNKYLRVAIIKSHVDTLGGTNGETTFENVVEKMLPDYNGTPFSISAGGTQSFDFYYNGTNIMPGNSSQVFIVAWVQDDDTKEVINSATDQGFYYVGGGPAPSAMVAAPGQTNTFQASVNNYSANPVTVSASLNAQTLPTSWHVNYTVNGTTYTDTSTITVAAHTSVNYNVNFVMTGGKGIGTASLSINKFAGDSLYATTYKYCSASNDVNTAVIDATSGTARAAAYQTSLAPISATVFGTITSDYTTALVPNDTSLKILVYISGASPPSDNDCSKLTDFMNGGGDVLLTGDEFFNQGDATVSGFIQNMFHTQGAYQNSNTGYEIAGYYGFQGVSGDSVSNGISSGNVVQTGGNGNPDAMKWWPDALQTTDAQAKAIFKYTDASKETAGVRVESTGFIFYKAVYLSFGLEAMSNVSARNQLMKNIIAWFNGSPTGVDEPLATPATDVNLVQNYPNPFGGTTDIQFTLPQDEHVTLNVYDMKGSLVATLANGMLRAGTNSVTFDGTGLAAGVYEYRLTTPGGTLTHLMSLVKN